MKPARILLNPTEAADYLRRPVGTLKTWRSELVGPPFEKCGRSVLYDLAELDRWLAGDRDRGQWRSMTPTPPRPKVATLADVLPADVAEFIRETAFEQRVAPGDLMRNWATTELAKRIASYQTTGDYMDEDETPTTDAAEIEATALRILSYSAGHAPPNGVDNDQSEEAIAARRIASLA